MKLDQCVYCGRAYPPAIPSREHVLPDSFGARLKLPEGAVCRGCNNTFNRDIDQPFKAMFQAFLAWFATESSKRQGAAPARVRVETAWGPEEARMYSGGRLVLPTRPRSRPTFLDDDTAVQEWRVGSGDDRERLISQLGSRWREVKIVEQTPAIIHSVVSPIVGRATVLMRAVAKAAINYLVFRRPDDTHRIALDRARQFVLSGDATLQLPVRAPTALLESETLPFDSSFKPVHLVAVGTDGSSGILGGSVLLFGAIGVEVMLSTRWDGPRFHAEHELDILSGASWCVDRGFLPPRIFSVVAEEELDRVEMVDDAERGPQFAHIRRADGRWRVCQVCSGPTRRELPTSEAEIRLCRRFGHAVSTRDTKRFRSSVSSSVKA
jgi:hypothetical protein